jgi:Cu2+-exporting ATPase
MAQWADQVAAWFVGALLLFAVAVFIFWSLHDAARAWPIAIAVLVVSCPCALSLATPSALAAATDSLLRQGVLVIQPHVLETLHRATHIVFDKTGTLTEGQPGLQQISLLGATSRSQVLQLAAALEADSGHPLARALMAGAAAENIYEGVVLTERESVAGQGLQARIDGQRVRIGSADFVAQLVGMSAPVADTAGVSSVYLATEQGWLARFDLADTLRSDARAVVDYFQARGKHVILLSGDDQRIAQQVADSLGIERALGGMLPQQKLAFVQGLQQQRAVVAMVGDGINDAAVLRAADVSFAMGSGAALAQSHADTVLLSGRLSSLTLAAGTAAQTMRVIQQNLVWATFYNVLAIPAAALGLLSPWMAGVGMSASSALVVLNALRLARLPRTVKETC